MSNFVPEKVFLRGVLLHYFNMKKTDSFRSMHTDEVGTSARELAQSLTVKGDPCNKPIVQFAGEATNALHFSTVHGATETGWREARVLAELYGKVKLTEEEKIG